MRKDFDPNYFRFPNLLPGGIVLVALNLLIFSIYWPESKVLDFYGPLGTLGRHLYSYHQAVLNAIGWVALGLHVLESVAAFFICRGFTLSATIRWTIQTFIFGVTSMMKLVPYKPGSSKKTS